MIIEPARDGNVFKQIFADHCQGFKPFRPRYDTPYYESLVDKMLSPAPYPWHAARVLPADVTGPPKGGTA